MPDLRTLSDRLEIDDLLTSYTRAVDTGDWELCWKRGLQRPRRAQGCSRVSLLVLVVILG